MLAAFEEAQSWRTDAHVFKMTLYLHTFHESLSGDHAAGLYCFLRRIYSGLLYKLHLHKVMINAWRHAEFNLMAFVVINRGNDLECNPCMQFTSTTQKWKIDNQKTNVAKN